MKIVVVGSGKLANALLSSDLAFESCEITRWEAVPQNSGEKSILVHAGSGRQLKECLAFCSRTKSAFIELSTGLETERMSPDFPLVLCPNTSILILKTLSMLKAKGAYFEDYEISITESHQSTKKTEPGTAFAFADSLNFPHNRIVSVRDPQVQQTQFHIPNAYLDRHAFHRLVFKDGDDEVTIETKVLGHHSYVRGVRRIIDTVLRYNLENKRHTVLELIEKAML